MQQYPYLTVIKRPFPAWTIAVALVAGVGIQFLLSRAMSVSSGPSFLSSSTAWFWLLGIAAAGALVWAAVAFAPRLPAAFVGVTRQDAGLSKQGVVQTALSLNRELSKVLGIIRARIGTDESYAASLTAAQARLAELPTSEQVRVIVSLLVAENHRMRLDSQSMAKQLEASRVQIDSLRARLEKANEVGLLDPLTNIGNRRCFDAALAEAVHTATARDTALAIVMGDLDNFKKVNDDFGHQVGDEVLKFFTQILVSSVRDGDTVARFGGEEFAIVLPNCREREAAGIAERIRIKLSAKSLTIRSTSQEIGMVTASFGVAELQDGDTPESLLRRADSGLYDAKKKGRNRVTTA